MLAQRYWWDGMYKDVHAYCQSCLTCASYQGTGRRVRPPLMPIPVGGPFYRVGIDIMELPQTVNGNRYVISSVADPAGGGKGGTMPSLSSRERHAHVQLLYKYVVAKNVTEEATHRVRYSGIFLQKRTK